jgi:hypothetical protein
MTVRRALLAIFLVGLSSVSLVPFLMPPETVQTSFHGLSVGMEEFISTTTRTLVNDSSLGEEQTTPNRAIRVQTTQPSKEAMTPAYHMLFSTSCEDQQNWESWVFFYHAYKVKQPGNITRIASGCTDPQANKIKDFHQKFVKRLSESFHLHLTPDYSRLKLEKEKFPYKYMNKPYGLRHWMEEHRVPDDDIIMLLDPDMILLRPLLHDFTNEQVMWVDKKEPATKIVRHGYPIAQQDGYLRNEWMDLNFTLVTQKQNPVPPPPGGEGPLHWNTGPPYLATARDFYNIAKLWCDYVPNILDIHWHLFSEMYGFIIASVQLKLRFTLIQSLVVSDNVSRDREGWAYIDQMDDDKLCPSNDSYQQPAPIGLHYCQRYSLGRWFFSKYRIKKNILSCDKALLEVPHSGIHKEYNYTMKPPRADFNDKLTWKEERKGIPAKIAKRNTYMLCHLATAMNEALMHWKMMDCQSPNLNKTYSVFTDPGDH